MQGISIPLSFFLIFFAIFVFLFGFYNLFNVYHLIKFGLAGPKLHTIIIVFVVVSTILLATSVYVISTFDWSVTLELKNFYSSTESELYKGI